MTTRMTVVHHTVGRGKWCPITCHFLHDDGIIGFQHNVEYFPETVRCELDWSEHPVAEIITEIRVLHDA
jgi:hypothetical protein